MAVLPGRHAPLWDEDVTPAEFAPLAGDRAVDVAVVGGGITGLTTALRCKEAGLTVAVVESRQVGAGTTGRTTGKLSSQHDLFYASLIADLGKDVARAYATANETALDVIREVTARYSIDAYLSTLPNYVFTRDESQVDAVRAEAKAAAGLGLPATFVEDVGLPFDVLGAVRFDDQLQLHPKRLVYGLAAAVDRDGSSVHEHTRAVDVSETGDGVAVRTDRGTVRADHAVIATLLPFPLRGFEYAKTRPMRAYGIAVRVDGEPPEPMYISAESPKRSLRHYHGDRGTYLVVVGEGHETGHGRDLSRHYANLIDYAEQHFRVRSVDYRWSAQDFMPVDGVPYVGRLAFSERVQIATGFKKWGLSNGVAAAEIMTGNIIGDPPPWAWAFDANRREPVGTYAKLIKDNLEVAGRFVADRVGLEDEATVASLEAGQGAVVRLDGRPVAVARDEAGALHAVDAVCTHLACVVNWNDAERSWDCPCHGSRFGVDGRVVSGPAVHDLARHELPEEA